MKQFTLRRLFFYGLLLVVTFVLCEVTLSFFVTHDADGNVWFKQRLLRPYHSPIASVHQNVEKYQSSNTSLVAYHAQRGWANRSNFKSEDGMFCHNEHGMRVASQQQYEYAKSDGVLRIALLGDSYIYGAEVPFESTIGSLLEQELGAQQPVEVLNFGVGAYGMDQALITWRELAIKFSPDVVVFGFQPENAGRNVNLIRALYSRKEALPFFKPRFILDQGLQLINSPTPTPDSLVQCLRNLAQWPLAPQEWHYRPADYEPNIMYQSNTIALAMSFVEENRFNIYDNERAFYALEKEPAQLTLKIVSTLQQEVEATGAIFHILHLPRQTDVDARTYNEDFSYKDLWLQLRDNSAFIETDSVLNNAVKDKGINALFAPGQHYSHVGNAVVAHALARALTQ